MIDFQSVAANALWILGLALTLAALSWANWAAGTEKARFRTVLGRPGIQRGLDVGLLLFCAGLAATGRVWWERLLWGLLAGAFGVQAWLAKHQQPKGSG